MSAISCAFTSIVNVADVSNAAKQISAPAAAPNLIQDVLDISAEGLEAYQKLENAKVYDPYEEFSFEQIQKMKARSILPFDEQLSQYSKHLNIEEWATGHSGDLSINNLHLNEDGFAICLRREALDLLGFFPLMASVPFMQRHNPQSKRLIKISLQY